MNIFHVINFNHANNNSHPHRGRYWPCWLVGCCGFWFSSSIYLSRFLQRDSIPGRSRRRISHQQQRWSILVHGSLSLPPLHRLNNLKKLLKYSRQRVTPRHPYRHRWICRAVQMDSGKLSLYNAGGEFFQKTKKNQFRRVRWIGKCVNSIPPIRR